MYQKNQSPSRLQARRKTLNERSFYQQDGESGSLTTLPNSGAGRSRRLSIDVSGRSAVRFSPNNATSNSGNSTPTSLSSTTSSMRAYSQSSSNLVALASSGSMVGMGMITGSRTNLLASTSEPPVSIIDAQNPLYDTLIKATNKRRASVARMNMTTASLLMPSVIMAQQQAAATANTNASAGKKSVCFSEVVRTSDGDGVLTSAGGSESKRIIAGFGIHDGDYNYDYDEQQLIDENGDDEEKLDEEERRKRTLARMKRKKEDAALARLRKYGYDPLNPPAPKSWAEWSMQRRDYQAALTEVLQCQKQPQLSMAALKGRKESVAFVKEDLLDAHLNKKQASESSNLLTKNDGKTEPAKGKDAKKSKDKKGGAVVHSRHHHAQLSDVEMEILKAYYYHPLFSGSRAMSFLCDLTALALIIFAISVPIWIMIPYQTEPYGPEYLYQLSMFQNCTILLSDADKSFRTSLLADLRGLASGIEAGVVALKIKTKEENKPPAQDQQQQKQTSPLPPSSSALSSRSSPSDSSATPFSGVSLAQTDASLGLPDELGIKGLTVVPHDQELATEPPQETGGNQTLFKPDCGTYSLGSWQTFLVGVMVFAALFGIFAFVLAMCGACSGSLPKRLYYYHSAAEMLFVSAMVNGAAVIGFPMCARYKVDIMEFSLGNGFYTGVVATIAYLISSILFNLDIIVMCTVTVKDPREKQRRMRH